ncbi:hypothetical protein FQA39_LY12337 [Lamprigera yunnana]|nr:hypothetical protein FQA39_LY12337 [Lamprigera yunnana]
MNNKGPECRVMLRRCLAIIVRKEGCQGDPGDFWMYESGYMLFQGFIAANSVCWWSSALQGATRCLVYRGYISPGALLVSSEPCSLEVLRGAWARRVLQPPSGYKIVGIEDIEECLVTTVAQTQWTPLPEAVCAVVLRLSSQGRPAGIESIREALMLAFPHVSPPSERTLYDILAQLTSERKLYHTSKGYFIVTPEIHFRRRRSRSHSRGRRKHDDGVINTKGILMSTEEALILVHGEMATIRDGEVTHQCIQTNLADVICGGNASDKIIYPRSSKRRSASFPAHRSPNRRGSFRLWGTSRRLRRSASTRTISKHCTDSSSSTDCQNSSDSTQNSKKPSLLSRLFRRSKRSQCQLNTFSAQFPPMEWFNSKAIHLHSVSTQTSAADKDSAISLPYYFENSEAGSARSATLPRQHRRQLSNDSTYVTSYIESRDQSPSFKQNSPLHASSTLPRNSSNLRSPFHSNKSYSSSRRTSRSSLSPKVNISHNEVLNEGTQRLNTSNSPIKETIKQSATKNSSIESLKTSHIGSKKSMKLEGSDHSNESTCAINKSSLHELTSAFKNSVALDNSGPSSIESHKSSKTGSSATSGPSSLESHRTVITRQLPPLDTQLKEPKSHRKSSSKLKDSDKKSKTHTKLPHSNSFTLQLTTNQGGILSSNTNNAVTATINGGSSSNTKIYVQNSPVRSVITFENGQSVDANPNLVIINDTEPVLEQNNMQNCSNESSEIENVDQKYSKNTNSFQSRDASLNNVTATENSSRITNETMNNSRKLSLQLSSKDSLSYKNLLKNSSPNGQVSLVSPELVALQSFGGFTKNSFCSNPPSPTKSYDSICGSSGNVFSKYVSDSKSSLDKPYCHRIELGNSNNLIEKNVLGSEPNICYKQDYRDKTLTRDSKIQDPQFPSLSDLSFNFTSLAAQKILQGVSINSIDTLVELNTAVEKQNNCDVIHTDFGLV